MNLFELKSTGCHWFSCKNKLNFVCYILCCNEDVVELEEVNDSSFSGIMIEISLKF